MPKKRLCRPDKHSYKPTNDIRYEKCETCKDVFPCKKTCEHLDCQYVRGEEMSPYWRGLLDAMGIDLNTKGLIKWSDRVDDRSKGTRRNRGNVRKLRQEGSDRAGGQVAELEHDNSLVRELSQGGGEVTFSAPALEEGLADGLGHGRGDVERE